MHVFERLRASLTHPHVFSKNKTIQYEHLLTLMSGDVSVCITRIPHSFDDTNIVSDEDYVKKL